MEDPSEKRIEKLFSNIIEEINRNSDTDDALTSNEIISALSEVILTINAVNLDTERAIRASLN